MKRTFTILIYFLFTICCYAQKEDSTKRVRKLEKIDSLGMSRMSTSSSVELNPRVPSYSYLSPTVQALTRYGEYPVDYHTGLVDMTIPIYEIKTKELSLPIEIKFHASGRSADEVNGILGMRWTLHGGGVVTRIIKGRPDEWEDITYHNFDPANNPTFDDLYNSCTEDYRNSDYVHDTMYDSEYDIFTFLLPNGKSGKFILKNENGLKKPMLIPYQALRIEPLVNGNSQGYYNAIRVTDSDGKEYYFGEVEYTETGEHPHEGMIGSIPTGWYLKYMISANKTDTIKYSYQLAELKQSNYTERTTTGDRLRDCSTSANFHHNDQVGPALMYMLYAENIQDDMFWPLSTKSEIILKSISYHGGKVNFLLRNGIGQKFLDSVNVEGANIRKIKFDISKSSLENELQYLRSIEFYSKKGVYLSKEERYSFQYFEPVYSTTPSLWESSKKKDWWGYYSLVSGGEHVLPQKQVWLERPDQGSTSQVSRTIGYSIGREPDVESKKLGMLKSIQYPTGGKTEFDYEANYYDMASYTSQNGAVEEGPGLRIKTIKRIPIQGPANVSSFKYGAFEDGRGHIAPALRRGKFTTEEYSIFMSWDYVLYAIPQTGQIITTGAEQAGYRIIDYWSDPQFERSIWGNNYVSYDYVTEYTGLENAPSQKIVYNYSLKEYKVSSFNINDALGTTFPKIFVDPSDIWMGGKLLGKTAYKKSPLGIFNIKSAQDQYIYNPFSMGSAWDMPTYRHVLMYLDRSVTPNYQTSGAINNLYYTTEKNYHDASCNVYGYGFRQYTSGEEKLEQHISTIFNNDGTSLVTTRNYTYDPQYLFTKTEEVINSGLQSEKKTYTYPFDQVTVAVYNQMHTAHIIDPLIQTDYHKNGKLLYSERTNYSNWGGHIYAPLDIATKKGNGNFETRINFYAYDNYGNVKSLSQAGGIKVCYLWGYKGRYPVAKIQNVDYSTIESVLGVGAIQSFAELNSPTDEQVASFLAPLRTTLNEAQVNTYTYKPMIGLSSETNAYGVSTRYDYDSYQRLKKIKDDEGNIKKSYDYHFKH